LERRECPESQGPDVPIPAGPLDLALYEAVDNP